MSQQESTLRATQLIVSFTRLLTSFEASGEALRIVYPQERQRERIGRLVVLDSSFNPPTKAHEGMIRAVVGRGAEMSRRGEIKNEKEGSKAEPEDAQGRAKMDGEDGECKTRGRDADTRDSSTRILLLLAVKNADKAPQPASFPVRLSMMTALAEALQQDTQLGIDIGVTRLPYFHDKARGIGESGLYDVALEQVYLAGYDTLVRVFDEKYYGVGRESTEGNMTLGKRGRMKAALDTFFQSAVLQVFLRPDDGWGSIEEQRDWLRAAVDARWAERILIVEGEDLAGVSSSRVRNKVKMGGQLDGLVDDGVKWWIEQEKLYQ